MRSRVFDSPANAFSARSLHRTRPRGQCYIILIFWIIIFSRRLRIISECTWVVRNFSNNACLILMSYRDNRWPEEERQRRRVRSDELSVVAGLPFETIMDESEDNIGLQPNSWRRESFMMTQRYFGEILECPTYIRERRLVQVVFINNWDSSTPLLNNRRARLEY
jgi:hypothetical protein